MKLMDLTGQTFGALTVTANAGSNRFGHRLWLCRCECGSDHVTVAHALKQGSVQSCGCKNPIPRTHGMTKTRVFRIWSSMRTRCENPKSKAWDLYGGRGISICARWRDFQSFLMDMGEPPNGMSIDRIDSYGNYNPENCRWATVTEQANNKRNNRFVVVQGTKMSFADACRLLNLPYRLTYERMMKAGNIAQDYIDRQINLMSGVCHE